MKKTKPSTQNKCHNFVRHARRHGPVIFGVLSLVWFIIRVGPRPSRVTYPCQQVALASAGGFIAWLGGVAGLSVLVRKALSTGGGKAVVCGFALMLVLGAWMLFGAPARPSYAAPWIPTDPTNTPMGEARGIHPARVVWSHNPEVTHWDGNNGHCWDPANNSQDAID